MVLCYSIGAFFPNNVLIFTFDTRHPKTNTLHLTFDRLVFVAELLLFVWCRVSRAKRVSLGVFVSEMCDLVPEQT